MIMTDFETWMLDFGQDHIFRMLEYRRPGEWTPLELSQKYTDQSRYVSDFFQKIIIKEAIELPDKDILIGYISIEDIDDDNEEAWITYKKLSQIELTYCPGDNEFEEYNNLDDEEGEEYD